MLCPHCDVAFHESGGLRKSINLPKQKKIGNTFGDMGTSYSDTIWGTFCPNCGGTIVIHSSTSGDCNKPVETLVVPRHRIKKKMAPEIPAPFIADFHEASAVLLDSPKSSAALSRRLLQRLFHEHFGIKKKDLFQEIDEYIAIHHPPSDLADQLHAVRSVGNMAVHPLKDLAAGTIVDVQPGEAEWLIELLDTLFDHTFVRPRRDAARKASLNAKLIAIGKPTI